MTLAKTLEEIKKVKQFAEEDVENGPIETLSGRRGRKNQAVETLKRLKREYKQELISSAAFIVVTGEKREAFTSTAVESFKCFAVDPNAFYEDLSGRIPSALYTSKESVSGLFDVVGRHLEDKASELDIIGYPQLIFKEQYRVALKTKEDLTALIKRAINEQVGAEIVGLQSVTSLVDKAINSDHDASITPIVLTTDSDQLALSLKNSLGRLHPRGVFLVVAGKGTKALKATEGVTTIKDPTKETVEQTLTSFSDTMKNR